MGRFRHNEVNFEITNDDHQYPPPQKKNHKLCFLSNFFILINVTSKLTRMHSSRMRTARMLSYG